MSKLSLKVEKRLVGFAKLLPIVQEARIGAKISPSPAAVSQPVVVTNSGEVREIIKGVMKQGRKEDRNFGPKK